jgi:hypothetical protein
MIHWTIGQDLSIVLSNYWSLHLHWASCALRAAHLAPYHQNTKANTLALSLFSSIFLPPPPLHPPLQVPPRKFTAPRAQSRLGRRRCSVPLLGRCHSAPPNLSLPLGPSTSVPSPQTILRRPLPKALAPQCSLSRSSSNPPHTRDLSSELVFIWIGFVLPLVSDPGSVLVTQIYPLHSVSHGSVWRCCHQGRDGHGWATQADLIPLSLKVPIALKRFCSKLCYRYERALVVAMHIALSLQLGVGSGGHEARPPWAFAEAPLNYVPLALNVH